MQLPSYMSLPTASALPIDRLPFAYTAKRRLKKNGIASALQLAEIASRFPSQLKHLTGISATKVRNVLGAELGTLPDFRQTAVMFDAAPSLGVPLRPPNAVSQEQGGGVGRSTQSTLFLERLALLVDMPTSASLASLMQPVGHQGPFGTCVGWAANSLLEYTYRLRMSAGYAYRGAKTLDGYQGEGSWLTFALQHFFQTGHVLSDSYSYEAAIRQDSINLLSEEAELSRAQGHTNLLFSSNLSYLPKLMRAILSNNLNPNLGPLPIAVSLALYSSFTTTSSALDGLISMPFPGEKIMGGHAMSVVGYIEANDPENPFGISYFMVRNSWGSMWAGNSAFNVPGHAMIPEQYFTDSTRVTEAYVCIGRQ